MNEHEHIEGQTLGSFVDGELDAAYSQFIIETMKQNPEVLHRVNQLRRAQDLMKLGFGHEQPPCIDSNKTRRLEKRKYFACFAVSIAALVISLCASIIGYQAGRDSVTIENNAAVAERTHRVILHISESDPLLFSKALDYAKSYIREYESRGGQVTVIANAGGIDLMRSDTSPFKNQILDIMSNDDNIHFIACATAIHELHKKGINPVFFDFVDTHKPAIDQIIEHVQDGWAYLKVSDLDSVS